MRKTAICVAVMVAAALLSGCQPDPLPPRIYVFTLPLTYLGCIHYELNPNGEHIENWLFEQPVTFDAPDDEKPGRAYYFRWLTFKRTCGLQDIQPSLWHLRG